MQMPVQSEPGLRLYMIPASPPVRGVLLTAAALGVKLNCQQVDVFGGETRTPEFLKMNPQHTVPTLDDNGFYIWDSHAICMYLANQYGAENSPLYPTDPKKRATVDQRLHFDNGVLYAKIKEVITPLFFQGKTKIEKTAITSVHEGYAHLETFLTMNPWVAGENMTIADLSCLSTISTLAEMIPLAINTYPKINAWLDKCKALPYYVEMNQAGLEQFVGVFKSKLKN